jgi:hypothetical protein
MPPKKENSNKRKYQPIRVEEEKPKKIIKSKNLITDKDTKKIHATTAFIAHKDGVLHDVESGKVKNNLWCAPKIELGVSILETICKEPDIKNLILHYKMMHKEKIKNYGMTKPDFFRYKKDGNDQVVIKYVIWPSRAYDCDLLFQNIMEDDNDTPKKHILDWAHYFRINVNRTDNKLKLMAGWNNEKQNYNYYEWEKMYTDLVITFRIIKLPKEHAKNITQDYWIPYKDLFEDVDWPNISKIKKPYEVVSEISVTIPCEGCPIGDYVGCFRWSPDRLFCVEDPSNMKPTMTDEGFFFSVYNVEYLPAFLSLKGSYIVAGGGDVDEKKDFLLGNPGYNSNSGYPGFPSVLVQMIKKTRYFDIKDKMVTGIKPESVEIEQIKLQESVNQNLVDLSNMLSNFKMICSKNDGESLVQLFEKSKSINELAEKINEYNNIQNGGEGGEDEQIIIDKKNEEINSDSSENGYTPPQVNGKNMMDRVSDMISF